jgi:Domain of unknown function (DUF4142)
LKRFGRAPAIAGIAVASTALILVGPASCASAAPRLNPIRAAIGAPELDLLVRMRIAILWQLAATDIAVKYGSSAKVIEVSQKIANEDHDNAELLASIADGLGVRLPDQPDAQRRQWLAELTAASGAELDRVFVDRLRTEDGDLLLAIAGVRAGTRDAQLRSLTSSLNDAVMRHMSYLESTGLVNFVELPTPDPGAGGNQDLTDIGPLGRADQGLLVEMRQACLVGRAAGQLAQQRAANGKVRDAGTTITEECGVLSDNAASTAATLGVTVPDRPDTQQQVWIDEIAAAGGARLDQIFINRLRAEDGRLLPVVAAVRADTRSAVTRSFAASAEALLVRHMSYLENTGLVDFDQLPPPPPPAGLRITGFQRQGGVPVVVIWLVLATAGLIGVASLARLPRAVRRGIEDL